MKKRGVKTAEDFKDSLTFQRGVAKELKRLVGHLQLQLSAAEMALEEILGDQKYAGRIAAIALAKLREAEALWKGDA